MSNNAEAKNATQDDKDADKIPPGFNCTGQDVFLQIRPDLRIQVPPTYNWVAKYTPCESKGGITIMGHTFAVLKPSKILPFDPETKRQIEEASRNKAMLIVDSITGPEIRRQFPKYPGRILVAAGLVNNKTVFEEY